MREIADRYRRLSDDLAATIAAVPPDRWDSPSPCEDWKAIDVVRHVVQTHAMFLGFVGRDLPEGPSVDDDPAAAWDHARKIVLADLQDPERATAEFEGMFGRQTFDGAVDRFLSTDLVVHRWDLAAAAGIDVRLDPDDLRRIRELCEGFGDAMRSPGAFGPELEPPDGADEQTRLLAFLGRKAW